MATSEDLVNKLFINPLESIGRKLKAGRRRHTSGVLHQIDKSQSVSTGSEPGPRSRHQSLDFGEPITVEVKDIGVSLVYIHMFS